MSGNVGEILQRWAMRDQERIALVEASSNERCFSYGELDTRAQITAQHLKRSGIKPGKRVAIALSNGVDFVSTWFGALYAGCTTVLIPPLSTAPEIKFRIEHAGCSAIISDAQTSKEVVQAASLSTSRCSVFNVASIPNDSKIDLGAPLTLDKDAIAMILYTSGTTGSPKGACISHHSLIDHTRALVKQTLRFDENERILGVLPLSHSFGIRMSLLASFCAGARTIFTPRFDANTSFELIHKHQITWLPAVPTMFAAWGKLENQSKPGSLKWCLSAGATLNEDTRIQAEKVLGASIRQGYGLTEASFSAVNAPPDPCVPGSVGKASAGVELAIVDPEGKHLPRQEIGEIIVRGTNTMQGYLSDSQANISPMREAWIHTGDIGVLDEEGRLKIVDRKKDLIIRGGNNIYPAELENVITNHPEIEAVSVIGIPDDYYGEEVVAIVVTTEQNDLDISAFDRWLRERISALKVPHLLAEVETLPQGKSGKVLRRQLREMLNEGRIIARKFRPN